MKKYKAFILILYLLLSLYGLISPVYPQTKEETLLYSKGNSAALKANWPLVIKDFKKLLKLYPNTRYQDIRYWIGHAYIEMEKYPEGIKWLKDFAILYPNNPYAAESLFNIGETYEYKLKDYNKAIKAYTKLSHQYPLRIQSVTAIQNKAQIYAQRSYDYKRAVKNFEKSKKIAKSQGVSSRSLYISRANQRINFIKRNSDYNFIPLKMYTSGKNREEEKKLESAINIYNNLIKRFPKSSLSDDAFYRKLVCYKILKDKNKLQKEGYIFIKKYPKSPYIYYVKKMLN